jgi:hypothetical protein
VNLSLTVSINILVYCIVLVIKFIVDYYDISNSKVYLKILFTLPNIK